MASDYVLRTSAKGRLRPSGQAPSRLTAVASPRRYSILSIGMPMRECRFHIHSAWISSDHIGSIAFASVRCRTTAMPKDYRAKAESSCRPCSVSSRDSRWWRRPPATPGCRNTPSDPVSCRLHPRQQGISAADARRCTPMECAGLKTADYSLDLDARLAEIEQQAQVQPGCRQVIDHWAMCALSSARTAFSSTTMVSSTSKSVT
jgi:hypothetical protein